jgi:hypothetical protein
MAAFVRDAEQMKLVSEISPDAQRRNIARAIEAAATELSFAQTYEAMTWIYDEYQSIWCPELTEVAEERKKELGI